MPAQTVVDEWVSELRNTQYPQLLRDSFENSKPAFKAAFAWRIRMTVLDTGCAIRISTLLHEALETGDALFNENCARQAALLIVDLVYPGFVPYADRWPIDWSNVRIPDNLSSTANPLVLLARAATDKLVSMNAPDLGPTVLHAPRSGGQNVSTSKIASLAWRVHDLVREPVARALFKEALLRWEKDCERDEQGRRVLPLPLPPGQWHGDREHHFTPDERFVVLAAIHDHHCKGGVEPISPWPGDDLRGIAFLNLVKMVGQLDDSLINPLIAHFEDVSPAISAPKPKSRTLADYPAADVRKVRQAMKRAKQAGHAKKVIPKLAKMNAQRASEIRRLLEAEDSGILRNDSASAKAKQ